MSRRNWKKVVPTSLKQALVLCKDHAREVRNLSVERIAELMGISPDVLYKWLGNGRMPLILIANYEHICGINLVTRYQAASAGLLVVPVPKGRDITATDMQHLQQQLHDACGALLKFYGGNAEAAETLAAIQSGLEELAWHRGNVALHSTPQLDL